jgi:hypothetical protein
MAIIQNASPSVCSFYFGSRVWSPCRCSLPLGYWARKLNLSLFGCGGHTEYLSQCRTEPENTEHCGPITEYVVTGQELVPLSSHNARRQRASESGTQAQAQAGPGAHSTIWQRATAGIAFPATNIQSLYWYIIAVAVQTWIGATSPIG